MNFSGRPPYSRTSISTLRCLLTPYWRPCTKKSTILPLRCPNASAMSTSAAPFDGIAQDHVYMDVIPFVSNMIQNICTFDTLLTFHPLGWSVIPLQIMIAPILPEAASTPCHLEFVEYLTKRSLHMQRSVWRPSTTPAPQPSGVNLESEQENAGSSRPKSSDLDSPMMQPAPNTDEPLTPSKPPE